jgi:hypothetical protein
MTQNMENDALCCDAVVGKIPTMFRRNISPTFSGLKSKQTARRAMSMVFMLAAVGASCSIFRESYVSQIEREHASQNSVHGVSKLQQLRFQRLQCAANIMRARVGYITRLPCTVLAGIKHISLKSLRRT